jgi:hypothetical protein
MDGRIPGGDGLDEGPVVRWSTMMFSDDHRRE